MVPGQAVDPVLSVWVSSFSSSMSPRLQNAVDLSHFPGDPAEMHLSELVGCEFGIFSAPHPQPQQPHITVTPGLGYPHAAHDHTAHTTSLEECVVERRDIHILILAVLPFSHL